MKLTMTLTVTPEQAAAIANLLTDTEVQALRSDTPEPAVIHIPAVAPQQNPTAPQTTPTAAPAQQLPASAAMPVSTTAPTPAAAPVVPSSAVGAPVQQQTPPPAGIPTQVRTYSVNDLAVACRPLMEAGKQTELQALLAEFGAPAGLASVPENRRAEFAGRLRQMGGQI